MWWQINNKKTLGTSKFIIRYANGSNGIYVYDVFVVVLLIICVV